MASEEKEKIKSECKNVIFQHDYFCGTIFTLKQSDCECILKCFCSEKGLISYEMINLQRFKNTQRQK